MKVLLLLILSSLSFAGQGSGNGGDAVVCRDSNNNMTKPPVLLDYYEGRDLRNETITNVDESEYKKLVKDILKSVKNYDEYLFGRLNKTATQLIKAIEMYRKYKVPNTYHAVRFTTSELEDIPDSKHLTFESGCKVEQLAIRVKKNFSDDPDFIFQVDILNALKDLDLAGIILHEAIYKEFNEENSINSRYFNQKISSVGFEEYDYGDYINLLANVDVRFTYNGVYKIYPKTLHRNPSRNYDSIETSVGIRKNGQYMNKRIAFDYDGNILDEETLEENSIDLYFEARVGDIGAYMKIEIGGKVCELSPGELVDYKDDWPAQFGNVLKRKTGRCTLSLKEGVYSYKVSIKNPEGTESGRLYYWDLNDLPFQNYSDRRTGVRLFVKKYFVYSRFGASETGKNLKGQKELVFEGELELKVKVLGAR